MSLLHLSKGLRDYRASLHAANATRTKHFLTIHRRSGLELAGGFLFLSILAIVGSELHGSLSNTAASGNHNSSTPAITESSTASTDSSNPSATSQDDLTPAPNEQSDGDSTNNVSISTNTTVENGTSSGNSQVSVNGHPITPTPASNGSTTHTFTTPDGQQTTVTATTNNAQDGTDGTMQNGFSSSNVYINSSSFSNKFEEGN